MLIVPVLLMFVLGAFEVGTLVRNQQMVVGATRAGARSASSAGDTRLADYDAVTTLQAALEHLEAAVVNKVIIYKANPDGSMPVACDSGSVDGVCNYYEGATFMSLDLADFGGTSSCDLGAADRAWCPLSRNNDLTNDPDWIGIRVEVHHFSFAPFLGDRNLVDHVVMQLEPRFEQ